MVSNWSVSIDETSRGASRWWPRKRPGNSSEREDGYSEYVQRDRVLDIVGTLARLGLAAVYTTVCMRFAQP